MAAARPENTLLLCKLHIAAKRVFFYQLPL
jgi:hypothetical protein